MKNLNKWKKTNHIYSSNRRFKNMKTTDKFALFVWKDDPGLRDIIVTLGPLDHRYKVHDIDGEDTLYGILRGWKDKVGKRRPGYMYGEILNYNELPEVDLHHVFSSPKLYTPQNSKDFIDANPALFI